MTVTDKQKEHSILFLEIASTISKFSKAERRKVGAVLVSIEGKIIGTGFNGTPINVDNCCESKQNETFEYVIHAEMNAIFNATTHDLSGSTIYITDSPCLKCAAAILQKRIHTVIYDRRYRLNDGIDFLRQNNVNVICIDDILQKQKLSIFFERPYGEKLEHLVDRFDSYCKEFNRLKTLEQSKKVQSDEQELMQLIYTMITDYKIRFGQNETLVDYINNC